MNLALVEEQNYRIQGWMGRAEQSTKFKGIFITPNQINKITETLKKSQKLNLLLTQKPF